MSSLKRSGLAVVAELGISGVYGEWLLRIQTQRSGADTLYTANVHSKMKIEEEPIRWKDLAQIAEDYHEQQIIFRGVVDYEYELIPAIGRERARVNAIDPSQGDPFSPDDYRAMIERFEREATPHVVNLPDRTDPWCFQEWECIGRHHGLSTKLLDWTTSPLIAAYFATEKSGIVDGAKTHAAIYGLMYEHIDKENLHIQTDDPEVHIYIPSHLTKRVIAQRGLFTTHNLPEVPFDSEKLIKWKILADDCFQIRKFLNTCGFNRATLFPDLDGISKNLRWLYKWQRLNP